jgi:hypothetical protein
VICNLVICNASVQARAHIAQRKAREITKSQITQSQMKMPGHCGRAQ